MYSLTVKRNHGVDEFHFKVIAVNFFKGHLFVSNCAAILYSSMRLRFALHLNIKILAW